MNRPVNSLGKVRRLLEIVEKLQSGKAFSAKDLASMCGVSHRTMFRDLKTLQDSGLPLLYDAEKQGYWLANSAFLPPTDLTVDETLALLVLAHEMGDQKQGIPFMNAARDAALKLLSNLPGELRSYIGELTEVIELPAPAHNQLTGARGHYQKLLQSFKDHSRIRLRYHSLFEGKEIGTLLSPYRLFFQNRSWYAVGRSSLHRSVRTFNLGRIRHSELTTDRYDIPPRFSLQRYFGDAWSMIRESERFQVVIRFLPLVATNVSEVCWHRTQRLEWQADGTLLYHATVAGLTEIHWWILGYGDQAEVLAPPALREMVAQRVQSMAMTYSQPKQAKKKRA